MTRGSIEDKNGRISSDKLFPGKLHDLLDHVAREGRIDVLSWTEDGRGFYINKPKELATLLPIYFGHSNYRSFHRQLNLWSFKRLVSGHNKGAFCHPYFCRGRKSNFRAISKEHFRSTHAYATKYKKTECSPSHQNTTHIRVPTEIFIESSPRSIATDATFDILSLKDGDAVSFEDKIFHFVSDDVDIYT